ncbi:MAG: sugar transferase [Gemmatimonadaceae bacterium]
MKRVADVAIATVALVLLSPICLVTAVAVRVAMGSPVLFSQVRPGREGRPFTLYKFRSMRAATGRNGEVLSDARRLTRFGRWLRSTSIDELPELWNVLRGDMSLVGPRPLLMQYLPLYSEEQARRHDVRPGITGWAQVHGRNALSWDDRFRLDVWYVDHRSLGLDLRILASTLATVLTRRGVSAPGEATVTNFAGSASNATPMSELGALHLSKSNT